MNLEMVFAAPQACCECVLYIPSPYLLYISSCHIGFNDLCGIMFPLPYILQIFEKNPTTIKNYGIWLRYQSRTGYHNMYKEYRDTTLNGGVEQMYNEMASRHRVRFPCIQIIKTATIPAKLCKRESTKQFHNSKIKFPLVFKKVRPPTRRLKTTYKASRPNLFM
jgi:large subunit ribosomal protein L18Ae